MKRLAMVAVLGVLAAGSAPGVRAQEPADDVAAGRALSLRICTACHVVLPDQEAAPILQPPAPSFRAIANRPGMSAETVRTFLSTTHSSMSDLKSMPNPRLNPDQIRQAAAFLMSLKKRS
jgi:mono/diheme cytochrome c family protein